ncbi:hypothetical protein MTO96_039769, partial [Rhipicephalus appendiculatus]
AQGIKVTRQRPGNDNSVVEHGGHYPRRYSYRRCHHPRDQ